MFIALDENIINNATNVSVMRRTRLEEVTTYVTLETILIYSFVTLTLMPKSDNTFES